MTPWLPLLRVLAVVVLLVLAVAVLPWPADVLVAVGVVTAYLVWLMRRVVE